MRGGWGAGEARRDGVPGLNGDGSPGRIPGTNPRDKPGLHYAQSGHWQLGPRATGTAPRSQTRRPRGLQRPGADWKPSLVGDSAGTAVASSLSARCSVTHGRWAGTAPPWVQDRVRGSEGSSAVGTPVPAGTLSPSVPCPR